MRAFDDEPPGAEKPPILPPHGQHPVAGDDQSDRVLRHRLTDVAGGFRPDAELLRQRAVSGRATPADTPCRRINIPEEGILTGKIEFDAGKIRLLALEIALHRSDRLEHSRRRCAGFGIRQAAQQQPFGRFR